MKKIGLNLLVAGLFVSQACFAQTVVTTNPLTGIPGTYQQVPLGGNLAQLHPTTPASALQADLTPSQKPQVDETNSKDKTQTADTDIPATFESFTKLHQKITPTDSNPYGKAPKWQLKYDAKIDYSLDYDHPDPTMH